MFTCEFCGQEFSTQEELNHHLKKYHKTETFIQKARRIHGDKYNYSEVEYIGYKEKIKIICPEHGPFYQSIYHHLTGCGCKQCGYNKVKNNLTSSTDKFIQKARKIHGNKYDYSKVNYINNRTKVCIICPEHGIFYQKPNIHLNGNGCSRCSNKKRGTTQSFIEESIKIHGNKYDYSKVNYINNRTKVCIICPIHGPFYQIPNIHLHSQGCPKCNGYGHLMTEDFIKISNEIHHGFYNYSKSEYINNKSKILITCPIHGDFYQIASHHMKGHGCPTCRKSKIELEIQKEFPYFEKQKKFEWLKCIGFMSLDFYDKNKNIAIECQGKQHFEISSTSWYGNNFQKQKDVWYRDKLKYQLCKDHGIEIIYYFPEEFLKYNIEFYKDKKCFHNIDDLKKYLETL